MTKEVSVDDRRMPRRKRFFEIGYETPLIGGPLSRGDFIERPPLGFHPNVGIARETWPAMLMITSSPAP
jgi:hypothetical protein